MNFFEKHRKALAAFLCLAGSTPLAAAAVALDSPIQAPASDTPPDDSDKAIESKTAIPNGQQNAIAKSEKTVAAAVPDRKLVDEDTEISKTLPEVYPAESNHYDSENIVFAEPVLSDSELTNPYTEPEVYTENPQPVYEQQNATETKIFEPAYTEPVYEEPVASETPVYTEPDVYTDEVESVYEQQNATEAVSYDDQMYYAAPVMNETETVVFEESAPVMTEADSVPEETATEEIVTPTVQEDTVLNEAAPVSDEMATLENTEQSETAPAAEILPDEANNAPAFDYSDLNESIRQSALSLVGKTDGDQCTEVVCKALEGAGVADPMKLWPDEYQTAYGSYTDSPKAGNLIYYDNGGRGLDHVAIYVGDGQAVHGNYNTDDGSHTVIAPADLPEAAAPQYIQVER